MRLWICLVMFVNAAAVQDMTGKVFVFPQERVHVTLNTEQTRFGPVTLCLRSFTELTRDHIIFFLATPSNSQVSILYNSRDKTLVIFMNDRYTYRNIDYTPNKWHSMCTTWKAETGRVQLWFNGHPMMARYSDPVSRPSTSGQPQIVLGEDPGTYYGGFDPKSSFVGQLTDIHMWDHELSGCEIQKYMEELPFTPGNIINWAALDFQIHGKVLIENKIEGCDSKWIK